MAQSINIRAGEFRKRVTLQKPLYNSPRDEIIGWETMGSAWASIEPGQGVEQQQSGREISVDFTVIKMRTASGRGVDTTWRITRRTDVYDVRSISDAGARGVVLTLTCRQVL